MTRHSKNTKSYFTHNERNKLKEYGTNVQRLGNDSMRLFDQCNLCQKPVVKPTCTKYGYIYCRECILSNILTQKKANKRNKEQLKQQTKQKELAEQVKEEQKKAELTEKYTQIIDGVLPTNAKVQAAAIVLENTATEDLQSQVQHDSMFWMPGAPASAPVQQTSTASVEKKVYDPMNNQPIRPKELVNLEFTPSKSSKSDDKEFNNRYMCPSCYKTFNNSFSDARAIQECGHVTCGECFKKFVAKESKCLVCSKKYKKTPITMQSASTGFANETVAVQAKTYNPSLGYM